MEKPDFKAMADDLAMEFRSVLASSDEEDLAVSIAEFARNAFNAGLTFAAKMGVD